MHALRRFLQEQLDARGWDGADLVRHSGVSKQRVYPMLADDRTRMDRMLTDRTITGLAQAFGVDENIIRLKVVEAMGVDFEAASVVLEMTKASDDELLHELARRLRRGGEGAGDSDDTGAPTSPARPALVGADGHHLPRAARKGGTRRRDEVRHADDEG